MEQLLNYQITDKQLKKIESYIDTKIGNHGGANANDTRLFIDACLYIMYTKTPWYNLPPEFGKYKAINRRFNRWRNHHIWDEILVILLDDPRFDWLLFDDSQKTDEHQSPIFSMTILKMLSPSTNFVRKMRNRINEPFSD